MKLKHNKRLLNALNANQLSAKWKVATENAEDGVASKNNGNAMAGNSRSGSFWKEEEEVMQHTEGR